MILSPALLACLYLVCGARLSCSGKSNHFRKLLIERVTGLGNFSKSTLIFYFCISLIFKMASHVRVTELKLTKCMGLSSMAVVMKEKTGSHSRASVDLKQENRQGQRFDDALFGSTLA